MQHTSLWSANALLSLQKKVHVMLFPDSFTRYVHVLMEYFSRGPEIPEAPIVCNCEQRSILCRYFHFPPFSYLYNQILTVHMPCNWLQRRPWRVPWSTVKDAESLNWDKLENFNADLRKTMWMRIIELCHDSKLFVPITLVLKNPVFVKTSLWRWWWGCICAAASSSFFWYIQLLALVPMWQ